MTETIRFPSGAGHELAAVLHRPSSDEPRGGVLLAHCFTCSKDLHTMTRLADGLAEHGWAVLRFDFTGIGDSGGSFTASTVSRNVDDVVMAAAALRRHVDGPLCLLGHSLGGTATLLAVERIPDAASVVLLATPSTPTHLRGLLSHVADEVEHEGTATVSIAGRQFPLSAALLEDLDRHDQEGRVHDLDRPLLVLHPMEDTVVPVAEGERIFSQAQQPKGFIPLPGADHLLSDARVADRVADLVADWLSATC